MFLNSLFLFYSICFIAFGHFVYLYYIISVIRTIPFSFGSLSTLWSYCTAWDLLFLDRYDFRIKKKTRELSAYIRKVLWSYVVEVVMTRVLRSWMGRSSFLQCSSEFSDGRRLYVSMPWKGRPSFLLDEINAADIIAIVVCQCPERGDPHFYFRGPGQRW